MRDSSLYRSFLFSSALCALVFMRPVHAAPPIILSNDASIPVQGLQTPVVPTKNPQPVNITAPVAAPTEKAVIPMAAKPENQTGTSRPHPLARTETATIIPPPLENPTIDEIEAALAGMPITETAPAPTPPPQIAQNRDIIQSGIGPVLRASPPPEFADPLPSSPLAAPIPPSPPEQSPPTLKISGERFTPAPITANDGTRLPVPNPHLATAVTVPVPAPQQQAFPQTVTTRFTAGVAPVSVPVAPSLPGVAVEPKAASITMAPSAEQSVKPRLVIEGPKTTPPAPRPVVQATKAAPIHIVDTFRARKGESFRDVIRRWSDRAGIDLVWAMPAEIRLDKDFSYVGKFETALNGLIAQYPESGLKATFVDQGPKVDLAEKPYIAESAPPAVPPEPVASADLTDFVPTLPAEALTEAPTQSSPVPAPVTPSAPRPTAPAVVASSASPQQDQAVTTFGPTGRWRALSGASMRQVLQAWAEDAAIPLVWASRDDFVVRYSVNNRTDYGRAVNDLLGQYAFEPLRPSGQIYRDPSTGQSTLVIRTSR